MPTEIENAIEVLINQYPKLGYTAKRVPPIQDPVFLMPIPVLPHKRGNIVMCAARDILKSQPNHCHDYFVINYAYRGNYMINIAGNDTVLCEGEICLYQPLVSHALLTHEDTNSVLLTIRIRKSLLFHSLLSVMPKNEGLLDFFYLPCGHSRPTRITI